MVLSVPGRRENNRSPGTGLASCRESRCRAGKYYCVLFNDLRWYQSVNEEMQ